MKNTPVSILAWVCIILAAFLAGLFVGRNYVGGSIQTSVLSTPSVPQPTTSNAVSSMPTTGNTSASQPGGKVNINTADIYALMSLEGIGETYAQRIIDYRNANGPFQKIEDIMNVTGIGEKRFKAIKDSITTGG